MSDRAGGIGIACAFLVIGCAPLLRRGAVRGWALGISGVVLVAALVWPRLLHPVVWLGRRVADVVGRALGWIALALLFYLVITPVGLLRRVFVRDPLGCGIDKQRESYWVKRQPPGPAPESMAQQF